jgi:hypothetical protein
VSSGASDEPESSTGYAACSAANPDVYEPDGKGDGNAPDGNACEYPAITG